MNHNATKRPSTLALAAGACVLAMAALTGCKSGHGEYTQEHLDSKMEAQRALKATNEWDLARQNFVAGELDKASKHINSAVELNDQVAKSWLLKGRIESESQRYSPAIVSLSKAAELDPENPEPHYYTGIVHERLGEREEALLAYRTASDLDPASGQYAVATAEMMIDLGQYSSAVEFLTGLTSGLENDAGVKQTLGHIAMINGETEEAIEYFNDASLLAPDDQAIVEDLAQAQVTAGRFAEAEYNLGRILEDKSNSGRRDLMHMRARCLMEVDRPVEARDVLLNLTSGQSGANDTEAWIQLGHTSYVLNDMNRVKMCASRVRGLAPDRYEGYMLRALWQRGEGDLEGAVQALNNACERRGGDVSPLILRGIVAREAGNLELSRASFDEVVESDPSNVTAGRLLAAVEAQLESEGSASTIVTVPEDGE